MVERTQVTTRIHKRAANLILPINISIICALVFAISLQCLCYPASARAAVTASTTVNYERVLLAIDGMSCTSCANGIKAMLKRTPGVISAEVSYERREADVEYDPSRTSTEKIIEAITNMGYKARVKE